MGQTETGLRAGARAKLIGLAAFALGLLTGPAAADSFTVDCPTESIADAIDGGSGRPSVDPLRLRVTGTCTENIVIPPGRIVEIVGQSGAVLRPRSAGAPALRVLGRALLKGLTVTSSSPGPDILIRVEPLGYLHINASEVASEQSRVLLAAYGGSVVTVINSTVTGGTEAAVQIGDNAHGYIIATAGKTTKISNPETLGGQAVGCWGGSLRVQAEGASSSVVIGPSVAGIAARGCHAVIGDPGKHDGIVRITGAKFAGIFAKSGDSFSLVQAHVTGNEGRAIDVTAGVMEIDRSIIRGNGAGLAANRGALIVFNDIYGPSQVTGDNPYSCYQDGRIYADPGHIVGGESTKCLTVGGQTVH